MEVVTLIGMCTGPSDPSATHLWMQILQASTFSYIYLYLPVDRYSKKKKKLKNQHKEVYFVKLTPYVLVVILLLLQRCKWSNKLE